MSATTSTQMTAEGRQPGSPWWRRGPARLGATVPLAVPALFLAAWWVVTLVGEIDPVYLPSPQAVASSGWEARDALWRGLWVSLRMIVVGFAIGGVLGVGAGLLFGYSRLARRLFEFTVDVVRPVPLIALVPIFILWFGIGTLPQITIVALGVFLIMSLATVEAVRNVPAIYLRAAAVSGATRAQAYRTVVLPAIMPHLLAGMRLAIAAAWGLDVAAEYTGSQDGLGYLMTIRQQYLDTSGVLSVVVIFAALAIAIDRIVQALTLRATRWVDRADEH